MDVNSIFNVFKSYKNVQGARLMPSDPGDLYGLKELITYLFMEAVLPALLKLETDMIQLDSHPSMSGINAFYIDFMIIITFFLLLLVAHFTKFFGGLI